MARLPKQLGWLMWEADLRTLDVQRDGNAIIPRVLECGRLIDVQWVLKTYGRARIHTFLRDVGDIQLTPRTLAFWRAVFRAKEETWANPTALRPRSAAPWID